ncbi:hypothetical protein NC651_029277 [Populus alba x Populus x berolinensis]|nr:hypothetical protein NC651_029277 [Populus alba x Populus x berolinensis]
MQLTWRLKTCSSYGGLKTKSLLQNLIIFLMMQEQELEEENKQLKTKLEEVVLRLPAIQGVGDHSKADGYKHSEPLPTLQMGHHQFVYQEQAFDARTNIPGKSNPTPRWLS